MIYLAVLAFGVTLGLPIAVIFASRAQGSATSTALEGIARQPDSAPRIQTAMIIGLALIRITRYLCLVDVLYFAAQQPPRQNYANRIDSCFSRTNGRKLGASTAKSITSNLHNVGAPSRLSQLAGVPYSRT